MGSIRPIEYRLGAYGEDWISFVLIPLRMLFTGKDDSPQQFDGLLNPIFLLALVPLIKRRRDERLAPWIGNSWLFVTSYFVVSLGLFYALVRYQAPLLIPVIALTVGGIAKICGAGETIRKQRVCIVVFLATLGWSGFYVSQAIAKIDPFGVWYGREARETFLQRRLSEYDVARFVNLALPADATVYLLFTGNRYFYYDRQVRGSYFSQQPIVEWLTENPDAAHLAEKFRESGITHLAIHTRRTWESLNVSLTEPQKAAWSDFAKRYLQLLSQTGTQTVWQIREKPEN